MSMSFSQRVPGYRLLHSPGPSRIPDEVVHAMSRQPMDMADPRFISVVASCEAGLKRLLKTEAADVFLYATNGHGAWEAVIVNLVAPGESVLIPGTGHFSDSWALQTEALGGKVVRTPWVEGYPIDARVVGEVLRADKQKSIVAVFMVHTDTASGITSDVAAMRAAIDAADHPALLVVDMVASLGVEPFAMDALGVNVVLGASQKGLMTPPGIGFVGVDALAFERAARNPAPRYYWDWRLRRGEHAYQKFCGTAPQTLLAGMEAALDLIFREGLEQVFARHAQLAGAVHAAVSGWSEGGALSLFCKVPAACANAVTTIAVTPGIKPDAIRTVARERFQVSIAGGLGPLSGRVFRIGHLGDLNAAMILGSLAGVQAALGELGIPHGKDGVARAVAALAAAPTR
jgi:alanine-glyoxylate transaminase/serine-glyoxylate transaminase/serine-pyruvate transaminase